MSRGILTDERGIAVPMALMVLVIVSALIGAFALLATSEPQIASNHMASAQVRALTESGVERAIWALGPGRPGGAALDPLFAAVRANATAPYDGNTPRPVNTAFPDWTVSVLLQPAAAINEVNVTSAGSMPGGTSRRVQVTLMSLAMRFDPPGALNVNGELGVSGSATVSSTGNVCNRTGVAASGSYSTSGTALGGSADICAGGSCSDNRSNCQAPACVQNPGASEAAATFARLKLSPEELDILKGYAKRSKTYWGPGVLGSTTGTYNGSVNFPNNVPSGIVFIDTVSGQPPSTDRLSDLATVRVQGDQAGGWLIVMGSADIRGNTDYHGLVYAADDITAGNGNASIRGAVIAHNLNNSNGSAIDTTATGSITIQYDCDAIRNGGHHIPEGFFPKGDWREVGG